MRARAFALSALVGVLAIAALAPAASSAQVASAVRFRPVLAEVAPAGAPEGVTEAEAAAITNAIASCDPGAVLALRVVATTAVADDTRAACVVLPVRAALGDARLFLGPAELSQDDIDHASRRFVKGNGYTVQAQLSPAGRRKFNRLTAEVFSKKPPRNQIAVTVDGQVVSAPTITQRRFPNGALQISGNLTRREAAVVALAMGGDGR